MRGAVWKPIQCKSMCLFVFFLRLTVIINVREKTDCSHNVTNHGPPKNVCTAMLNIARLR